MPDVTAIIPTWNRRELLARLLDNLRRQTRPPRETLVVDNGSTDDSADAAAAAGARVIPMGVNAGFARAVNRGIRESRTEWVVIVNNDVAPAPDWLEKLEQAAGSSWFATGKLLRAGDHRM
ncbi:MAG: glycosyltransferase, partial [Bryobacteraceae bacterium]